MSMSVKEWKYLYFLSVGILITAIIFVGSIFMRKDVVAEDKHTEREAWSKERDSLKSEINVLRITTTRTMQRDTTLIKNIKEINNYYSQYYGKINDTSFNGFDVLIDSLLERHDRIPYKTDN